MVVPTADEPTVVIVEDEVKLAELYAEALPEEYVVRIAHDGDRALEIIDHTTDVVLLDRRLPSVHGDTVLSRIHDADYHCRVIMVTAVDPAVDIAGLPFEAYITKPVDPSRITEAVNEQLVYATYDTKVREYTRLRSQIELLRETTPSWRLAADDRFERLCAQADAAKEDIEDLFEGHTSAVSALEEPPTDL